MRYYLKNLYEQICKRLDIIEFEYLWNDFHRYDFALYTSKTVLLDNTSFNWNEHFIGNTAINYNGKFIAIWNIEHDLYNDNIDLDVLTANIVHEMFHAFQYENGESRFPRDLITLMYPFKERNFELRYIENKKLSFAFIEKDISEKLRLLNEFCAIRHEREKIIGDMCKCEYLSETTEGMAEYVGTCALKMLSFSKYAERTSEYAKILSTLNDMQFNIRKISYYSGALLLLTAHDAGIHFWHSISKESDTVFEIICKNFSLAIFINNYHDGRVKQLMSKIRTDRKNKIRECIDRCTQWIEGQFYITGYDPMNMLRVGDYILCKNFIKLTNDIDLSKKLLMGITILKMEKNSSNKVFMYCRL